MKFSVIIPTKNETNILGQTIQKIRQTSSFPTEIIVVDGGSNDNTASIASSQADQTMTSSHACRACQLDQGAKKAKGELLIFLHADTHLPHHWQKILQSAWSQNKKPAMTAFQLSFDSSKPIYRLFSHLANWRTKWLTGVPHGDQAIAMSRETYTTCGGFPHTPLMEEYYLTKKAKKYGSVKILNAKITTSARRYMKNGPVFNACRNLLLIGLFHLGIPPKHLVKLYR